MTKKTKSPTDNYRKYNILFIKSIGSLGTASFLYILLLPFYTNLPFIFELFLKKFTSDKIYFFAVGILVLIVASIIFCKSLKTLSLQRIHNQPSYVYFLYWGILLSHSVLFYHFHLTEYPNALKVWYFVVTLFFGYLLLHLICPKRLTNNYRFAAGAKGLKDDALEFKKSAQEFAKKIYSNDSKHISIYAVYGEMGAGKSSYIRMVTESLDDPKILGTRKFLYTYISFTETNEAKDFSKCFSERWAETLAERYPFLNTNKLFPLLSSIFRENGGGFWNHFFNLIADKNRGLLKTKAKFWETEYSSKRPSYTSNAISSMFSHIPEIKEEIWIIVVDEIERALFDEQYRLIEAIERFKNEGRSGLPIRIVFILPISRLDLTQFLEAYKNIDPRAYQLATFFENPKSITLTQYLPHVSLETKVKFVINDLKSIFEREGYVPKFKLDDCIPNNYTYPVNDFIKDKKISFEVILSILSESTPRTINRCMQELEAFQNTYKTQDDLSAFDTIFFGDLLTLSFIRVEYPYLIDFFKIALNKILPQSGHIDFERRTLIDKKLTIIDWVKQALPKKLLLTESDGIHIKLISLVAHSLIDRLTESGFTDDVRLNYHQRTSDPTVMRNYLNLHEGKLDDFKRNKNFLFSHQKGSLDLTSINDDEFLSYSWFIARAQTENNQIHLDLAQECKKRLTDGTIPITPCKIRTTFYYEYQIAFTAFAANVICNLQANNSEDNPSPLISKVFELWKEILQSAIVPIYIKFFTLSTILARRNTTSYDHKYVQTAVLFEKYFKLEITELVRNVFQEFEKYYLDGTKVIYEKEEDFFSAMYLNWSGNPNDAAELEKIRTCAKRSLESYPEAIQLYWDSYPFDFNWQTAKDINDEHQLTNGKLLYLRLGDLIEVSEATFSKEEKDAEKYIFWKKIWEDKTEKAVFEDRFKLTADSNTLRALFTVSGSIT